MTVAVPSRSYYEPSVAKPLNGCRFAVKDVFDLRGLCTGASNRAFRDFYGPKGKSASVVQTLIDKGVVIVGNTKTTTFADREIATSDWIDYHSPFNPRGDGYIWGGGSSTGSAAAVATYKWLDSAIGSDSKRIPFKTPTGHTSLNITLSKRKLTWSSRQSWYLRVSTFS